MNQYFAVFDGFCSYLGEFESRQAADQFVKETRHVCTLATSCSILDKKETGELLCEIVRARHESL